MKDKKIILDYIGQVFTTFGVLVIILTLLSAIGGEESQGYSTMFELGGRGLTNQTLWQYFLTALLTVAMRFIFCTDCFIKRMSAIRRRSAVFISVFLISTIFVIVFKWIPIHSLEGWALFVLSFVIGSGMGITLASYKEKDENKKMEEALRRLKEEGE